MVATGLVTFRSLPKVGKIPTGSQVWVRFDDASLITRIEEYANFIPAGQDG
ncbi:hypothetical protein ABZ260_19660 [Streptosporangium sp. NPDC006013]|uniref:hypothetical protein n=1 Tax=Streptosporangium sp. NPDC006013 TaxID=3155596 RepID=UPI0033A4A3F6